MSQLILFIRFKLLLQVEVEQLNFNCGYDSLYSANLFTTPTRSGENGLEGDSGITGAKGDVGQKGGQGATGKNGEAGYDGIDGDEGGEGSEGLNGAKGIIPLNCFPNSPRQAITNPVCIGRILSTPISSGVDGDRGANGRTIEEPGLTGPAGEIGTVGEEGPVGPVGDTGLPGDTGDTAFGPAGDTGDEVG